MEHYLYVLLIGALVSSRIDEVVSDTPSVAECTKLRGATCIIKSLPAKASDSTLLELPDLSKRSTLRIEEGSLHNLTEQMANKLPVRILWLEGLELKSVFVANHFEELHLRDNKLSTLVSSSSVSIFALKVLDVRQNLLHNASQLGPFHLLEELYMDGNQFTELSMSLFVNMLQLRVLSAARNGIVHIVPSTSTLVLGELTKLSLAHNRLRSISMEKWQLPALQTLLLNHNNLTELEGLDGFEMFYDLQKIELAGNRWSCGWLQHALENVTISKSGTNPNGIQLDADTDCSIEKVHGICCSFTSEATAAADDITKPVDVFLPEINQMREAIVQIDHRHEAFRLAQSEQLNKLNEQLQSQVDAFLSYLAEQQDESEQDNVQAARLLQKVSQLEETVERMDTETSAVSEVEKERKRLLHFMVDMKNRLLRQAIETDSLWVQANAETVDYARSLDESPSADN
uniref:Leucine-rich immune protein (Short) n=1 Tax=Anopheles christyi TaxID=43041 RepID=A0A182JWD3_9DIPT